MTDKIIMIQFYVKLLLLSSYVYTQSAAETSIRGVSDLDVKRYTANSTHFTCLNNVQQVIPRGAVNDDFCDCKDGTDEPGTSACPDFHFFCANKPHVSNYIPSSRVNDGICDCCDGTDEYDTAVQCKNTCKEEHAIHMEKEQGLLGVKKMAKQIQEAYIEFAENDLKEFVEESSRLEQELESIKPLQEKLEKIKFSAQAHDDKLKNINDNKQYTTFISTCPEKLIQVSTEFNEMKKRVSFLDRNVRSLLDLIRPLKAGQESSVSMNDQEVSSDGHQESTEVNNLKTTIAEKCSDDPVVGEYLRKVETFYVDPSLEDKKESDKYIYSSEKPTSFPNKPVDACEDASAPLYLCLSTTFEHLYSNAISVIYWHGWRKIITSFWESCFSFPNWIYNHVEWMARIVYQTIFGNAGTGMPDVSDAEMDKLATDLGACQEKISEVKASKEMKEQRIKEITDKNSINFGPNSRWRKLYQSCIELDTPEYVYELCFFDHASQKSKNGGSTTIGKWKGFGAREGKTSVFGETEEYKIMTFDNGVTCWNGPARSLEITLECGPTNKILQISEPSKCEYAMKMSTFLVCDNVEPGK